MRIGFFGLRDKEKESYYLKTFPQYSPAFIDASFSEEYPPKQVDFDIISIFVECRLTKNIIDLFPNLKFVAVRSTGFDNVDIEYAKQKGILVSNVPAYGIHTVAEFTFGLILSLSRNIPQAFDRVKKEGKFSFLGLRGIDLFNKTLGVVGTGKIGTNVIRIAKGFNMKVLANDKYPDQKKAEILGFRYTNLEELFRESDIVTLHVPATSETTHAINSQNIFYMKKGSFLINTSRGSVVETKALYDAITKGHLAGAALDVVENENNYRVGQGNILKENPLASLPNVLITPHMAFYTKEAEQAIMETTAQNIASFTKDAAVNLVN